MGINFVVHANPRITRKFTPSKNTHYTVDRDGRQLYSPVFDVGVELVKRPPIITVGILSTLNVVALLVVTSVETEKIAKLQSIQ